MLQQIRFVFFVLCMGGVFFGLGLITVSGDWIVEMDKHNWTCTAGHLQANSTGCEQWTKRK